MLLEINKGGETLSAFASIKMMWVKSRPAKVSGNLDSSWLWVPNLWALMLQPNSSRPEATLLSPLVILSWRESHCPTPQGECWRPILERCCSCAEQMDGQMDGQRGRWMDRGADDTRQTTLGQQHSGNRCWHGLDLAHSFPLAFPVVASAVVHAVPLLGLGYNITTSFLVQCG